MKNLISRLNLAIKKEGKFCSSKLTASADALTEKVFSPLREFENLTSLHAAWCNTQLPCARCKTQSCLFWLLVYACILGARPSLAYFDYESMPVRLVQDSVLFDYESMCKSLLNPLNIRTAMERRTTGFPVWPFWLWSFLLKMHLLHVKRACLILKLQTLNTV